MGVAEHHADPRQPVGVGSARHRAVSAAHATQMRVLRPQVGDLTTQLSVLAHRSLERGPQAPRLGQKPEVLLVRALKGSLRPGP